MENLAASLFSQTDVTVTIDEVVQQGEEKLASLDAQLEKEKEEALNNGRCIFTPPSPLTSLLADYSPCRIKFSLCPFKPLLLPSLLNTDKVPNDSK